jgi:hypothetical protein
MDYSQVLMEMLKRKEKEKEYEYISKLSSLFSSIFTFFSSIVFILIFLKVVPNATNVVASLTTPAPYEKFSFIESANSIMGRRWG